MYGDGMRSQTYDNGIQLKELDEGVLVRQYQDAYIARRWRLSSRTDELVRTAVACGFRWMIRRGHPQVHARWPSGRGRVYLAFSPTRICQWTIAIDTVSANRDDYGFAVFNGKYRRQFDTHGIVYEFEKRNRASGHLVVARERVLPTLGAAAGFDHSVLSLRRSRRRGDCFTTEYDIQRSILFNWMNTPFGPYARIIGDEVPVDDGPNPRRIDILARVKNGEYIVFEIKRAEARPAAIAQLQRYLEGLASRETYADAGLRGTLVAERIPATVAEQAEAAGIAAYEIEYPLVFRKVTNPMQ